MCLDVVRSLIRNIIVILPILGLTWVFGVIAINSDLVAFQFIFAIANSLQVRFIHSSFVKPYSINQSIVSFHAARV